MRLEPVYADGAANPGERFTAPGGFRSDPGIAASAGVRAEPVAISSMTSKFRTTGRVAVDENRLYRLNTSTELWVKKIYPPTAGSFVRKGEPLLQFYTSNFYSAASALMFALNTQDRQLKANSNNPAQVEAVKYQVRQAVENLQNLGLSDIDIAEMERSRRTPELVTVRAPTDGYVISRPIALSQWVPSSGELYQIADLSRVWIMADLFAGERRHIRPGLKARVIVPEEKVEFTAVVDDVPPAFDIESRTQKIRLTASNPGMMLRPGMFVDVEFLLKLPDGIYIPRDALVDSGARKTVYIETGAGAFEPRDVETGSTLGDRVQITAGLAEGERIVTAGTFLVDSESRMRLTAATQPAPVQAAAPRNSATAVDPICGMEVKVASAHKLSHGGKTYFFCSEDCKAEYARKMVH